GASFTIDAVADAMEPTWNHRPFARFVNSQAEDIPSTQAHCWKLLGRAKTAAARPITEKIVPK
ncbi:hypothetical protein ABTK87_19675, partial [Acinetobacter baumannii]